MSYPYFPGDPRDATLESADPSRAPRQLPPHLGGVVYSPALLALYQDLPTTPEVLLGDEELRLLPHWGDDLTRCTAKGYLAGAAGGALAGLRRAIVEAERGESAKLRLNRVLNNCGAVGRAYANRAGVIGMLFASTKTIARTYRSGAEDWVNTAAAGVSAGALFNMPGGPRAAVVGGVLGGLLAGTAIVAGKLPAFNRSKPTTTPTYHGF